jgi:hypothetical protein
MAMNSGTSTCRWIHDVTPQDDASSVATRALHHGSSGAERAADGRAGRFEQANCSVCRKCVGEYDSGEEILGAPFFGRTEDMGACQLLNLGRCRSEHACDTDYAVIQAQ